MDSLVGGVVHFQVCHCLQHVAVASFASPALPLTPRHGAWQDLFMQELVLRKNWRSGTCKGWALLGHTRSVVSVSVRGSVLASGSLDKSIRLWDLRSGQILRILRGHQVSLLWGCYAAKCASTCTCSLTCFCACVPQRGVWALCFHGKNLLVSGSHDHTIKVSRLLMPFMKAGVGNS